MTEDSRKPNTTAEDVASTAATSAARSDLPPAARRALGAAAARRAQVKAATLPRELGGRDGPEPVRFGDWEKKGIAIDF